MGHVFPRAIELVASGKVDVTTMVTHTLKLQDTPAAFAMQAACALPRPARTGSGTLAAAGALAPPSAADGAILANLGLASCDRAQVRGRRNQERDRCRQQLSPPRMNTRSYCCWLQNKMVQARLNPPLDPSRFCYPMGGAIV